MGRRRILNPGRNTDHLTNEKLQELQQVFYEKGGSLSWSFVLEFDKEWTRTTEWLRSLYI